MILRDFFAHQKTSKIWILRKSYAGGVLEKVGNLAMEICSIPSIFYITEGIQPLVNFLNWYSKSAIR